MDLQGVELERHVKSAQQGDPLAMAALLRGLAPWVGRICGSIALDDGDDAMQETMIRVLKGIRSLREPAALRGWVRRIAVREAIKLAQARRDPLLLDRLPERAAGDAAEVGADIADVLWRLTPEQRAILVLRDLVSVGTRGTPFSMRFEVELRDGWCLMRSRLYLVGMAATPLGERTRFVHLEGLPYRGAGPLRALRPVLRRVVAADVDGIARELARPAGGSA